MAFSLFSVVDKIPKHPYFAPTTHTSYFLLYWSIKSKIQLTTSLSNYTPSWHFKVQAQTDTHTLKKCFWKDSYGSEPPKCSQWSIKHTTFFLHCKVIMFFSSPTHVVTPLRVPMQVPTSNTRDFSLTLTHIILSFHATKHNPFSQIDQQEEHREGRGIIFLPYSLKIWIEFLE